MKGLCLRYQEGESEESEEYELSSLCGSKKKVRKKINRRLLLAPQNRRLSSTKSRERSRKEQQEVGSLKYDDSEIDLLVLLLMKKKTHKEKQKNTQFFFFKKSSFLFFFRFSSFLFSSLLLHRHDSIRSPYFWNTAMICSQDGRSSDFVRQQSEEEEKNKRRRHDDVMIRHPLLPLTRHELRKLCGTVQRNLRSLFLAKHSHRYDDVIISQRDVIRKVKLFGLPME